MLSNYTFDTLLQGQGIQSVEIERHMSIYEEKNLIKIFDQAIG